jgi:Family of unknown function (DUF6011)
MRIASKFNGRCHDCGGRIAVGEQCEWERGNGVRHIECPEVASANGGAPSVGVTLGVFRKDEKVFVVKPNKERTRSYAKEIVASPARITESGAQVDFEAVYRPGMIYNLTEGDRWALADAREFLTQYGRCIVCGRHLKAAKSVHESIGPVCSKYFA